MAKGKSKVTSKLQVTLPKAVAEDAGIRPGDTLLWENHGPFLTAQFASRRRLSPEEIAASFAASEERTRRRWEGVDVGPPTADRGWTRDDLYFDEHGRHR